MKNGKETLSEIMLIRGDPNIHPTTLLSSFLNISHVTYECYNDNIPERKQATHVENLNIQSALHSQLFFFEKKCCLWGAKHQNRK